MEPTTVSLPWLDIAKLALGTGFIAAVINQAANWVREWRRDAAEVKREATYLALRVAVTLERFAIDCAMLISDNTAYEDTAGELGQLHSKLPDMPPYPGDVNWKSIDPEFASQSLSIRNELPISNEHIAAGWSIDPGVGIQSCNRQAGLRGYRAWTLATKIRQQYSLPNFDPRETAWDMVGLLVTQHDASLANLRQADERP